MPFALDLFKNNYPPAEENCKDIVTLHAVGNEALVRPIKSSLDFSG